MAEIEPSIFSWVIGSILVILTLSGIAIWQMQSYIVGRTERELDDLERLHFKEAIADYINNIISSKLEFNSGKRGDTNTQLTGDEISNIIVLSSNREVFRYTRDSVDEAKTPVFATFILILILSLFLIVTYFYYPLLGTYSYIEITALVILGLIFFYYLNLYRKHLGELRDCLIAINDDLTEAESRGFRVH